MSLNNNVKKKKSAKKVDDESKQKLKALFTEERRIIDGFPFNINNYIYKNGKPAAYLECEHRRRPDDGDIECPAKTKMDLEGNIAALNQPHNHLKNETLKEERAFHNQLIKASSQSGEDLNKIFNLERRFELFMEQFHVFSRP
ncbi:hypothetical protein KQX54_011453 [Cotesia glomerata]|uniref:Uncharacterized protein n=1 Tax=Cotesia glomerata TaxID=32391 RepID=A0AAV7HCU7_COTGL|nr:hypothetical protein KQX54_011453 [Cotesia glomerata]